MQVMSFQVRKWKKRSDAEEITILRFRLLKIQESTQCLKLWLNSAQRSRPVRRSLSAPSWVVVSWCCLEDATKPTQTSITQQQKFLLKGAILQDPSGKMLRPVQFQFSSNNGGVWLPWQSRCRCKNVTYLIGLSGIWWVWLHTPHPHYHRALW